MSKLLVRPAVEADLEPLTDIYNHYVETSAITFDVDVFTPAERRAWFEQFEISGSYRLFVATLDERAVGYASSVQFRRKRAYRTSVETAIYCRPEAQGQGVGRALYEDLFAALEGEEVHRAYAGVALPNPASVAFHERFGFEQIGVFHEVGFKFERYWDVAWFEKKFGDSPHDQLEELDTLKP